jgi:hypothetical protein
MQITVKHFVCGRIGMQQTAFLLPSGKKRPEKGWFCTLFSPCDTH